MMNEFCKNLIKTFIHFWAKAQLFFYTIPPAKAGGNSKTQRHLKNCLNRKY